MMGLARPFLNSNPTWYHSEKWVFEQGRVTYYSFCEIHRKFLSDFADTLHW